jgi:hypothetical protein
MEGKNAISEWEIREVVSWMRSLKLSVEYPISSQFMLSPLLSLPSLVATLILPSFISSSPFLSQFSLQIKFDKQSYSDIIRAKYCW